MLTTVVIVAVAHQTLRLNAVRGSQVPCHPWVGVWPDRGPREPHDRPNRYKGFVIILVRVSRGSQPCTIPPVLCGVLYLVAMRMER